MAPTVNGAYRGRYAPGQVMFPVKAFNESNESFERSLRMKQEALDTLDLVYAFDEGPNERSWALQLLSAIVDSQPEIGWQLMPQVLSALEDDTTSVNLAAIEVLKKLQASQHVERILDFLKDPEASLRSAAAECLGEMNAWTMSEELRPCFSDSDSSVVKSALQAVQCWGESGQPLASSIVQCLDHSSAAVRCSAVQALTTFAEASERFAGHVAKLLDDSDFQTKDRGVQRLRWQPETSCELHQEHHGETRGKLSSHYFGDIVHWCLLGLISSIMLCSCTLHFQGFRGSSCPAVCLELMGRVKPC